MAELLTSFRRLSLRLLATGCLLLLPTLVLAQGSTNYCEAPAAIKEELKKLTTIDDVDVPYKVRRERQLVMLQDLLKKYPDDFFVQRRYQIARLTGFFIDREGGNLKFTRLEGLPLMAEAYAWLKQLAKAREVLAQLNEITEPKEQATDAQKRSATYGQGVYWQTVGKVAELEQRKLDALTA